MFRMRVHFIAIGGSRIGIAGSYGKTAIAAMIMHVLRKQEIKFGYVVGSETDGFENIAVLNDIARDHMNVFPTFENYIEQFRIFTEKISSGGSLIYFDDDIEAKKIALASRDNIRKIPFRVHGYFQNKTGFYAATHNRVVPVKIFGEQNMQNLSAAREVCIETGIAEDDFYEAIKSFKGI